MKGYWLDRGTAIFATQKTPYKFDRLALTLNRKGQNKNKKFFVPEYECTDQFRAKNIPCQEQIGNDIIDQLVANVSFTDDTINDDALTKQLKQARLQKIKTDTKLINQKLDQRKKLLFAQWSEKFFQAFSNHFGKLKNMIIQLHLNQDQVTKFNQCLDNCLQNLQLNLDQIWNEFQQEKEDEQT